MAFKPTDLPPVAPAISRCGMLVRSVKILIIDLLTDGDRGARNCFFLEFSPTTKGLHTYRLRIRHFDADGTLPGMGAMMRMPSAARLRAISSSSVLIREIRTPAAGMIS